MYHRLLTALSLAAVTTALALPAEAQPRGDRTEMLFFFFDSNEDNRVERAEIEAIRSAEFAKADTDGNGLLTTVEMQELRKAKKAEILKRIEDGEKIRRKLMRAGRGPDFVSLDEDGSGTLSLAEFMAPPTTIFAKLDLDGDNVLTRDEIADAKRQLRETHRQNQTN